MIILIQKLTNWESVSLKLPTGLWLLAYSEMESWRQLIHNIKKLTDRTVLIVTHRKAVLEIADQVVEMEG